MYKSYVLIGIIGIIIIAYLGLLVPISATTGYTFTIPVITIPENGNGGGSQITGNMAISSSGDGDQEEFVANGLECSVFRFNLATGISTEDYHTAFEVLRNFVPSCEQGIEGNCIQAGMTGILAVAENQFVQGNITTEDGDVISSWILFGTAAIDGSGNIYMCSELSS